MQKQNRGAAEDDAAAGHRAVLVGLETKGGGAAWTIRDSLEELGKLATTAGLRVAGTLSQALAHPDPGTWIGSGKVRELGELLLSTEASYAVFDGELSPGQQRKLEAALGDGVLILDRTRLVLDIFSQHAHTREGKLQVELAQHQYLLPRLTGMRTGLAQQVGGSGAGPVGVRGPGETLLEIDRRRARRKITLLRRELEELRGQRRQSRALRERSGLPVIALVGYTNAGKSSLLNALTGAGVLVEDKLFSTLDPTTRRLKLPSGREALLTDTVGFIRKLPHDLVAAFRATLEGIREASLILHVVDSTHPHAEQQVSAVDEVLAELGASHTPRLLVWNKIDLLPEGHQPPPSGPNHERAVALSARRGDGTDALLCTVDAALREGLVEMHLLVPYDRYAIVRLIIERGTVTSREDAPEGVLLRVCVPAALEGQLAKFAIAETTPPVPELTGVD